MTPGSGRPAEDSDDAAVFVGGFLDRSLGPGLGRISDITQFAPAPGGARIAFTGRVREARDLPERDRMFLVRTDTGELTEVADGTTPGWSSDGRLLAYFSDPSTVTVVTVRSRRTRSFALPGIGEYLRFAPGMTRLLVGIADPDADRAGAAGSGGFTDEEGAGITRVEGGQGSRGWRRIWRLDTAGSAAPVRMSPSGCNVWEADWCVGGVVAIASDLPEEGAWYASRIVTFDRPDRPTKIVATADDQLGLLCASPDGQAIAFVEAICSDRGVIAGTARIIEIATGLATTVDGAGVDIASLAWRDDTTLLAAGQRHLSSVVAEISRDGRWHELWESVEQTCGNWYPLAMPLDSGVPGAFAAVLHGYGRPPALTVITPAGHRSMVDTETVGTRYVREVGGRLTGRSWQAEDGLGIEGLLAAPDAPGPHPLVVLIHGGPVAAYRPSWQLIYGWTPLLVAAGYAVLHPNPRGSGGRGQPFTALVRGDMGGADSGDITSAVDVLAIEGVIDPDRVAVAGRSYGGYLASWLVTGDRSWAASVPMAPVTNWFSHHFTSNLGPFAEDFLADRVSNPTGRFYSRSPVFFADRVRAPVLTIAGGRDRCTPLSQATEFHRALTRHGRDSTIVIYPDEGHHIESPAAVEDLLSQLLGFLDAHLGTPRRRSEPE
ncbi:S9 family peptidase [Nakamurella lactea]|uniref:S9 family peptidase n=1 Tax=Nakamurella lactea TaxID=459515 RepID=UPI000688E708|nr:prolyl oligopeptidase family serine peptidase [Nakamurella lactea]